MSNNGQYVGSDGSNIVGISPVAYEAYLAEKASNQSQPPPAPPANMAEVIAQQMANAESEDQTLETVPVPVPGGTVRPADEYADDRLRSVRHAGTVRPADEYADDRPRSVRHAGTVRPADEYADSSDYIPPPATGSYAKPINDAQQPANMADVISRQLAASNQPQPIAAVNNPFTTQKNTIKPVNNQQNVTDFAVSKNSNSIFNTPRVVNGFTSRDEAERALNADLDFGDKSVNFNGFDQRGGYLGENAYPFAAIVSGDKTTLYYNTGGIKGNSPAGNKASWTDTPSASKSGLSGFTIVGTSRNLDTAELTDTHESIFNEYVGNSPVLASTHDPSGFFLTKSDVKTVVGVPSVSSAEKAEQFLGQLPDDQLIRPNATQLEGFFDKKSIIDTQIATDGGYWYDQNPITSNLFGNLKAIGETAQILSDKVKNDPNISQPLDFITTIGNPMLVPYTLGNMGANAIVSAATGGSVKNDPITGSEGASWALGMAGSIIGLPTAALETAQHIKTASDTLPQDALVDYGKSAGLVAITGLEQYGRENPKEATLDIFSSFVGGAGVVKGLSSGLKVGKTATFRGISDSLIDTANKEKLYATVSQVLDPNSAKHAVKTYKDVQTVADASKKIKTGTPDIDLRRASILGERLSDSQKSELTNLFSEEGAHTYGSFSFDSYSKNKPSYRTTEDADMFVPGERAEYIRDKTISILNSEDRGFNAKSDGAGVVVKSPDDQNEVHAFDFHTEKDKIFEIADNKRGKDADIDDLNDAENADWKTPVYTFDYALKPGDYNVFKAKSGDLGIANEPLWAAMSRTGNAMYNSRSATVLDGKSFKNPKTINYKTNIDKDSYKTGEIYDYVNPKTGLKEKQTREIQPGGLFPVLNTIGTLSNVAPRVSAIRKIVKEYKNPDGVKFRIVEDATGQKITQMKKVVWSRDKAGDSPTKKEKWQTVDIKTVKSRAQGASEFSQRLHTAFEANNAHRGKDALSMYGEVYNVLNDILPAAKMNPVSKYLVKRKFETAKKSIETDPYLKTHIRYGIKDKSNEIFNADFMDELVKHDMVSSETRAKIQTRPNAPIKGSMSNDVLQNVLNIDQTVKRSSVGDNAREIAASTADFGLGAGLIGATTSKGKPLSSTPKVKSSQYKTAFTKKEPSISDFSRIDGIFDNSRPSTGTKASPERTIPSEQPLIKSFDTYITQKPTKSPSNVTYKTSSPKLSFVPLGSTPKGSPFNDNKTKSPSPYMAPFNKNGSPYNVPVSPNSNSPYMGSSPVGGSPYGSASPYISTSPYSSPYLVGSPFGSMGYPSPYPPTKPEPKPRYDRDDDPKKRNRSKSAGLFTFYEVNHKEIATADQMLNLFGGDDIERADSYKLGFESYLSENNNGKRTSSTKRQIKKPIKSYKKIRHSPSFDLGLGNLAVKSKPAKKGKGKGVNKKALQFF